MSSYTTEVCFLKWDTVTNILHCDPKMDTTTQDFEQHKILLNKVCEQYQQVTQKIQMKMEVVQGTQKDITTKLDSYQQALKARENQL
jgi:hypothetical protein